MKTAPTPLKLFDGCPISQYVLCQLHVKKTKTKQPAMNNTVGAVVSVGSGEQTVIIKVRRRVAGWLVDWLVGWLNLSDAELSPKS